MRRSGSSKTSTIERFAKWRSGRSQFLSAAPRHRARDDLGGVLDLAVGFAEVAGNSASGASDSGRYVNRRRTEPLARGRSRGRPRGRVLTDLPGDPPEGGWDRATAALGFYANRAGKGTHRALARYERLGDRHRYVLRGDIYRYFQAMDDEVLKADLLRRIACRQTLAVLDRIVDASNPQEPVNLY